MIIKFKTETGSSYEVDSEAKKIRRLSGTHEPTDRQGQDDEWKSFAHITPIAVGNKCLITWNFVEEFSSLVAKSTLTTVITEVQNDT